MKKILSAAVALAIAAGAGLANAQPGPRSHDPRYDQRAQAPYAPARAQPPKARPPQARPAPPPFRPDPRYEYRAKRQYKANRYQPPRGYQTRQWHRGDRLPDAYRSRAYVVEYKRYGLTAPPRGYQYVRVGNDVMLTAIATGVVTSVIMSLFN